MRKLVNINSVIFIFMLFISCQSNRIEPVKTDHNLNTFYEVDAELFRFLNCRYLYLSSDSTGYLCSNKIESTRNKKMKLENGFLYADDRRFNFMFDDGRLIIRDEEENVFFTSEKYKDLGFLDRQIKIESLERKLVNSCWEVKSVVKEVFPVEMGSLSSNDFYLGKPMKFCFSSDKQLVLNQIDTAGYTLQGDLFKLIFDDFSKKYSIKLTDSLLRISNYEEGSSDEIIMLRK